MDEPLLQKTGLGREVLRNRGPALDARSRQLLVLCNGRMSAAALRALFGEPTDELLQDLLKLGLIEAVEPIERTRRAEQPAPAPELDLRAAQARALALLEQLFGPGGGSHGDAVRQARDAQAFEAALLGVQQALSVYQGGKRAARLVQQIRGGAA
jgi:hypothetical protein